MIDADLDGQRRENGAESEARQQEFEQKIARAHQYNFLMKLAAKLRHAGLSVDVIEVALLAANRSQCEEPYPSEKVREIAARAGTWKPKLENVGRQDRRTVIIASNRQLDELAAEAFRALQKANEPPVVFGQGQDIVHIVQTREGWNVIRPVDESAMRGLLSQTGCYIRITETGQERDTFPPIEAVREVISRGRQVQLNLPLLKGIVDAPTPLPDGRMLTKHGYDEKSGLFCIPGDIDLSDMPEQCDVQDAKNAREYLENELLEDFPFEDDGNASRTHALAAIITPVIRHAISDLVPMAVVDGTAAGSGKGLLVNLASIIATGREAHLRGLQGDDEEIRKAITAALVSNPAQIVVFDNVAGIIKSAALERALTSKIWSDRILGRSGDISVAQRATWMMTANNVYLAGDLPRRVYRIRLKPDCSYPYLRTEFRHPDLEAWTLERRETFLRDVLTMWRAWWCAGCPKPSVKPLGSFAEWTTVVGGILEYSGCLGFLANFVSSIDDMDTEPRDMAAFLAALQDQYPNGFTAPGLVKDLQEGNAGNTLPLLIPDVVAPYVTGKKESSVGLGKVFKFRTDRRYFLPAEENESGEAQEFWLHSLSPKRPILWFVESEVKGSTS